MTNADLSLPLQLGVILGITVGMGQVSEKAVATVPQALAHADI